MTTLNPDFVPKGVIEFLERLPNPLHMEYDYEKVDIEVLRFAIQSANMEKAWRAISRRSKKADPIRFARAILDVSWQSRNMGRFSSPKRIKELGKLAEKTNRLADEIGEKAKDIIGQDWYFERGYPLRSFLQNPPAQTLRDIADYFDDTARDFAETRTELTAMVGKPGAPDSRRVYAIRLMSKWTSHLYGQPLHDVVARTCCEILGEDIDSELVRKLVKIGRSLSPSYWSGVNREHPS